MRTHSAEIVFGNVVRKCYGAYKNALEPECLKDCLPHMLFEINFKHLWTVQNLIRYAFSRYYAVYNPVNQKFGFVTNISELTEEDKETLLQMEIDERDINYTIKDIKECKFVPSVINAEEMERKYVVQYRGQKNYSSEYSSYIGNIDEGLKEKHRIRQFNGVDVPNAIQAPYFNGKVGCH